MAENLSIKKSPVECILECPLCLHHLKQPLTLQQCLHSYCKSCLDKVPQKTQDGRQGWLCPLCENFTKCDLIEQNTFIEELQKVHNEPEYDGQIKCGQCLDDCGEATWKCVECKIGLCVVGKALHLKIPMLRGHKILQLDSARESLIDNVVFCKVHKDIPVQTNCQECNQLICYKCNTTDHQDHRVETIEQALDKMLPEIESSVRKVNEKISIIESQIEGISNEVEQTKESYASRRMQIDDHLEKVICRMRAIKAQMEEDVNEQESIALNTLTELQQQLEKQLSQARIISNLTSVVTNNTRHTSQLQQLQSGLFEKVKSSSKLKNQRISFNLPATKFIEGQRFKEEIDIVFGKLSFDIIEQIISISGDSFTYSKQFLCMNLNKLAKTQFKKAKEIVVDADWCNHLSYIDNKIWLPLHSRLKINIYDEDGEVEDVIDIGDKDITVVKAAHNGDLICAGYNGLFVTDKQFNKWSRLSEGVFSDVVFDNDDQFIALRSDDHSVHTFSKVKPVNNGEESSWHESHSFILNEDVKITWDTCICIVDEQNLLISADNGLYKFTCVGEYLDGCKDLPFKPVICGPDGNNLVLVAEFSEGTMYLFNPLSQKETQRTAILSSVQTPQTRSVIIDRNNDLWVLAGEQFKGFKLIKFVC